VVVDDAQDTAQDRVTIQEAGQRLGVKEDAISKRIQRGTLRHEKTPEGRVFVWVDAAQDATQDTAQDRYRDASQDALLTAKDETIAALREQLAQANERDRENRRIIAALTQRIPAIEAPSEARESPEMGSEEPEGAHKAPARCPGAADGRTEALVAEDVWGLGGTRSFPHNRGAASCCLDLSFIHGFIADSDRHLERFSVLLVRVLFDGRHDVVGVPVGSFERERSLGFDAVLVVQGAKSA
jgi:hypothetical protein